MILAGGSFSGPPSSLSARLPKGTALHCIGSCNTQPSPVRKAAAEGLSGKKNFWSFVCLCLECEARASPRRSSPKPPHNLMHAPSHGSSTAKTRREAARHRFQEAHLPVRASEPKSSPSRSLRLWAFERLAAARAQLPRHPPRSRSDPR